MQQIEISCNSPELGGTRLRSRTRADSLGLPDTSWNYPYAALFMVWQLISEETIATSHFSDKNVYL